MTHYPQSSQIQKPKTPHNSALDTQDTSNTIRYCKFHSLPSAYLHIIMVHIDISMEI
jgi:hypothetical protein